MKIYPKTDESFHGLEALEFYARKYRGIEIQMLSWDDIYKIKDIVKSIKERIPEIEEITVHPPLIEEYNFEVLTYTNFEKEQERIKCMIETSNEFNIKMNLLYHTRWDYNCWKSSGAIERLKYLVNIIQNSKVNIVIENIFSKVDKKDCTVLNVAKHIDNPHLGVCLDICHLHVEANIYGIEFNEFLPNYLNKEDCKKYVYQIHFAGTLDNDGYRRKETHGRKHDTIDNFKTDYNILKQYEIEDKIIVVEISEDDYNTRVDQLEEIKMLEEMI